MFHAPVHRRQRVDELSLERQHLLQGGAASRITQKVAHHQRPGFLHLAVMLVNFERFAKNLIKIVHHGSAVAHNISRMHVQGQKWNQWVEIVFVMEQLQRTDYNTLGNILRARFCQRCAILHVILLLYQCIVDLQRFLEAFGRQNSCSIGMFW